ncbi:MAG: hypothetical protein R3D98_16300 [Candidatus Krumholzibacteriia bacterium]
MPDFSDDEKRRIEQEARLGRRTGLAGALAGRDGGDNLRGASPTPVIQRALLAADLWLRQHLEAPDSSLRTVLLRHLEAAPELLEAHVDRPASLLAVWLPGRLEAMGWLEDLVREVDMAWGRLNDERPHFERPGTEPDVDDPYTLRGVGATLTRLLAQARAHAEA